MKTKVDIISGFLGAGKTTLIKKLIEEKLHNEKLAIIENEFGEMGIDGAVLRQGSIEVKEINSGCICCTLAGDFEEAIGEILSRYRPDRLIIEPSGVGKLSDVVKACDTLKDRIEVNMLVTVVDVLKYQIYIANFGEFFENQITHAKTIVLSRTQKIDNQKLEAIVKAIHKINEKANIITTPWESLNAGLIIGLAEQDAKIALENQMQFPKKVHLRRHGHPEGCTCGCEHTHHHSAEEVFEVWSVESPRIYSENEIKDILKTLESDTSYGMVLRGKGILQAGSGHWLQFDYVPGEMSVKSAKADYSGRVCIIGKDINTKGLNQLFHMDNR